MLNSYTGETTDSEKPALLAVIYLQLEIPYGSRALRNSFYILDSGTNIMLLINDHGIFGSELVVADIYASI